MYVCGQSLIFITFAGSDSEESASNGGDLGSFPGLGRSPGEGKGNPLQCSCLENPMDRGDWWAMVHRVTKSRTQLCRLNTHAITKMPQTDWHKQKKLISSQFWRLEVQDQGVSRAGFSQGLSPWLTDGHLPLCLHMVVSRMCQCFLFF